jgi:hypothetical protein
MKELNISSMFAVAVLVLVSMVVMVEGFVVVQLQRSSVSHRRLVSKHSMGQYDFFNQPLGGKNREDPLDEQWKNTQEQQQQRTRRSKHDDEQQQYKQQQQQNFRVLGTSKLPEGQSLTPYQQEIQERDNYHPGEQQADAFGFNTVPKNLAAEFNDFNTRSQQQNRLVDSQQDETIKPETL